MYVCTCMYVCMYVCTCMYVCMYVCMCRDRPTYNMTLCTLKYGTTKSAYNNIIMLLYMCTYTLYIQVTWGNTTKSAYMYNIMLLYMYLHVHRLFCTEYTMGKVTNHVMIKQHLFELIIMKMICSFCEWSQYRHTYCAGFLSTYYAFLTTRKT